MAIGISEKQPRNIYNVRYATSSLPFVVSAAVEGMKLYGIANRETIPLFMRGEIYDGVPVEEKDCEWIIENLTRKCKSHHDCDTDAN